MFRKILLSLMLVAGLAGLSNAGQWHHHDGHWYWYSTSGKVYFYSAPSTYYLWDGAEWQLYVPPQPPAIVIQPQPFYRPFYWPRRDWRDRDRFPGPGPGPMPKPDPGPKPGPKPKA